MPEKTSYSVDVLRKQSNDGTLTEDGASWLLGYERAALHVGYVESYGGDMQEVGDVPWQASDAGLYRAGWDQAMEDHGKN
jgi:hypothetical protein